MRFLQISVIILFVLLQGCGSKSSPVTTSTSPIDTPSHLTDSQTTVPTNRYLWGIWDVRISGDRETVEIIPDRNSTIHFNTVRLMEEVPCTACIIIILKQFIPPDVLSVDFRLQHPFPGPMNHTAFDIRGIIINGADYTFPATKRSVGMGHDNLVLLDPDGYTTLFNPTEFPVNTGMPPILSYYPGKLELDGDLSSTLNPFFAYSRDLPRRVFYPASAEIRNIHVRLPDGPVEFGYAVDASWMPVENVVDPLVDFPPEANCVEAYRIDLPDYMEVNSNEMSEITVEIFDHQGIETIFSVTAEAPELFSGEIQFDFVESTGVESCTYSGEITNELNTVPGNYPLLIRVTDKFLDDIHWQIDAWQIGEVTVVEPPKVDPIAIADAYPLYVVPDELVHFFENGSYDPDGGDIQLYEWDWENDGVYDVTDDDVYFSWDEPGTYEVQFRVTDDEGATGVLDEPIVIVVIDETMGGWARNWGGSHTEYGYGVATDGSGNVYVTGKFQTSADFDPDGGDPHASNGGVDVFLSKFDSSGSFEWARTWGGSDSEYGNGVATDDFGNIYVAGWFRGTVDFNPAGGDPHTSNGGRDVFLSKFDSSGNFEWARTWGGSEHDYGNEIATDGSGNVYVTGRFEGTAYFDPGGGDPHKSNGSYDAFLSKFDTSGNFDWARTWGGSIWDEGWGVAADSSGNVYVTGNFKGISDFDPNGGDPHTAKYGGTDAFLSKFDTSGNFDWARTWGGAVIDSGFEVATDGSGNVYITGYFKGISDFDPDGGDPHTTNGDFDVFLSKFDPSGNFEWARTWGGSEYDCGWGVAVDGFGNVYVTGSFSYTVDFDPDGGDPHTSNGKTDVFLSKFDSSDNFEWVQTWGGSGYDIGRGVAADGTGIIYTSGYFRYTVDFAPTDSPCNEAPDEHISNGEWDVFLTKHLPDGCW